MGGGNVLVGQTPIEFCGVIEKPPLLQGQTAKFFDRFGNAYTDNDFPYQGDGSGAFKVACISGFFQLLLIGSWTPQEEETICRVFSDLSEMIDYSTTLLPDIHLIIKKDTLPEDILGTGSPYWMSDCGIADSPILEKLYGTSTSTEYMGILTIDLDALWHTIADDDSLQTGFGIDTLHYDLYSVALHEALHILGIGSRISMDGTPLDGSFYSRWDKFLFSVPDTAYLINPFPTTECCSNYDFNYAVFDNMPDDFEFGCSLQLGFKNYSGYILAPVNVAGYIDFTDGLSVFLNKLSHIDTTCTALLGLSSANYVMHPGISAGEMRRVLTGAELEILCALGYHITDMTEEEVCEQPCEIFATPDTYHIYLNGLSANNPLTIPVYGENGILSNDTLSEGVTISFDLDCFNIGDLDIDINSDTITITAISLGIFQFCYTLESCNDICKTERITIIVNHEPIEIQCSDPSCNLICYGDFEDFLTYGSDNYFFQFDTEDQINDYRFTERPNSPDIIQYNDNNVLHLFRCQAGCDWETVSLPLSHPVPPGCEVTVGFSALSVATDSSSVSGVVPTLLFTALDAYPCSSFPFMGCTTGTFNICGYISATNMTPDDCGVDLDPAIILPSGVTIQDTLDNIDFNLVPYYTFTWVNTTDEEISTLLMSAYTNIMDSVFQYHIYIDSVSVVLECDTNAIVNAENLTICAGQTTTLTALSGSSYLWSNGSNAPAIIVSPDTTTTYTVTVTLNGSGNCTATGEATVTVNPLPDMPVIENLMSQYCIADTVQLSPIPSGGVLTVIDPNGNDTDIDEPPYNFIVGIEGVYLIFYEVTNEWGCTTILAEVTTVEYCCPPPPDETPEVIDTYHELLCCLQETDFLIDQNTNGLTMEYDNMAYIVQNSGMWSTSSNELISTFGAPPDGILRINADIIIPRGISLDFSSFTAFFGPQGRIIVEDGAVLKILNSVNLDGLTSCNVVWQGIRVVGPGIGIPRAILTDALPNYGVLDMSYAGNSSINNAIIGGAGMFVPLIDVTDMANQIVAQQNTLCTNPASIFCQTLTPLVLQPSTNSTEAVNSSGGVIISQNGVIYNCLQGFNLSWYTNTAPIGTIASKIEGTTFRCSSTGLIFPFNVLGGTAVFTTEACIYGEAYSRLFIGNNNQFGTSGTYGIPKFGIRGLNVNSWTVEQNDFIECTVGASLAGTSFSTSNTYHVKFNKFNDCLFALQVFGGRLNTVGNEISGLPGTLDVSFGTIAVQAQLNIYNDYIDDTYASIVLLNNSWSTNIVQECVLTDNRIGVWLIGDNDRTFLYCNQFLSNTIPWLLQDDTDNSILGMLGDQGNCLSPPMPADNVFINSTFPDITSFIADGFDYYHRPVAQLTPTIVDLGGGTTTAIVCGTDPNVSCRTWQEIPDEMINGLGEEKLINYVMLKKFWNYLLEEQDTASAMELLNSVDTEESTRLKIAVAMEQGNYTLSNNLALALPDAEEESHRFKQLVQLETALAQTSRTCLQLTSEEEALVREIAATNTLAAMDARIILYSAFGEEIMVTLPQLPSMIADSLGNWNVHFKNQGNSNHPSVTVYPNPVSGLQHIQMQWTNIEPVRIQIYNSWGAVIHEELLSSRQGLLLITTHDWTNGLYFYRLTDVNHSAHTGKIIFSGK